MGAFDDLMPAKSAPSGGAFNDLVPKSGGAFDDLMPKSSGKQSSATGAFARSAETGVVPAAGATAGFSLGFEAGLPAAPFTWGVAPFVTGLAGAGLGGYLASKGQEKVLEHVPESAKEVIGLDEAQRQADQEQHPTASFAGEIAPQALFMRPSLIGKLPAAIGATVGGGLETGQELARGEKLDPTKIGIATGVGAILQRPTALGRGFGLKVAPRPKQAEWVDDPSLPPAANAAATGSQVAARADHPESVVDMLNRLDSIPISRGTTLDKASGKTYAPLEDNYQRLKNAAVVDDIVKSRMLQEVANVDPKISANLARLEERGLPAAAGTPERALQIKWSAVREAAKREYEAIEGKSKAAGDPNDPVKRIPRVRIGVKNSTTGKIEAKKRNWFTTLTDKNADNEFVPGVSRGGLHMTDEALKHREYFVMVDRQGNRMLVNVPSPNAREFTAFVKDQTGKIITRKLPVKRIIQEDLLDKELAPHLSSLEKAGRRINDAKQQLRGIPNIPENLRYWNRALAKVRVLTDAYTKIEDDIHALKQKYAPDELHGRRYVIGAQFTKNSKEYKLWHATIDEIGEHTGTVYHDNIVHNWVDEYFRLRKVARNLEFVKKIKDHPEFENISVESQHRVGDQYEGWREVLLPQFRGRAFRPDIANQLDDMAGKVHNTSFGAAASKINNFMVRAIFYNPLPHDLNVLSHWINQRGISQWLSPAGMVRLSKTAATAMHDVATMSENYLTLLREGQSLLYGGLAARGATEKVMKALLPEVEKMPAWKELAGKLGLPVKKLYELSSKGLWMPSDIMALQAVYENMGRYKLSFRDAIYYTEKHIPNYRIPATVMNSRFLSEIIKNTFVSSFGRYHYGVLRSYGETARGLINAKSNPKSALATSDQLAMLAVQLFFLYPALDEMWKKLLDNPEAKQMRFGAERLPSSIDEMASGERDPRFVMWEMFTPSPAARVGMETITGIDMLTGKPYLHAADLKEAPAVFATDLMKKAASELAPFQAAQRISDSRDTMRQALLRQIGVKDPRPEQAARILKGKLNTLSQDKRRQARSYNNMPNWMRPKDYQE